MNEKVVIKTINKDNINEYLFVHTFYFDLNLKRTVAKKC